MSRRPATERLLHATERLDRHPLALGVLVLVVVGFLSYLSVIAINGIPFSDPYRVRAEVPAGAPLLKDGDEVRIAGQRAGTVRDVAIGRNGGALLSMDLDEGPIGRDATATVRLRGLAGATYTEIDPGDVGHPLPEDGLIPPSRTGSGVELTDVVDAFDPSTAGALRRTLSTYGIGLLGRGADLNQVAGDLAPALTDAVPLLRAATPGDGELAGLLAGLRRTARGFATPGERDLAGLLGPAAATFGTLDARGADLQTSIDRLVPVSREARRTLPVADVLLAEASPTVRALTPTMDALARALPAVDGLLEQRRALPALSRLADRATPVLADAQPLLRELAPAAGSLAPLAEPLGSLSGYMARYAGDIFLAPDGFTRWGRFRYPDGQAPGARAVRFAPVFTCARARDPYPAPGAALDQEQPCRS